MLTRELQNTLSAALNEAIRRDHGYVTLEHLLLSLLSDRTASDVIYNCGGDTAKLKKELEKFFKEHDDKLKRPQSRNQSELPEQTVMFERVLQYALLHAEASELKEINGGHLYGIRYFSPKKEIALCGHATLAAAKIIFENN